MGEIGNNNNNNNRSHSVILLHLQLPAPQIHFTNEEAEAQGVYKFK
jgi:hypothetical protein